MLRAVVLAVVLLVGVSCTPVRGGSSSTYSCWSNDPAYPCPMPPPR